MRDGKLHWINRNLSGQTFGALTALAPSHSDGKKMHWRFRCQCGRFIVKVGSDVTKEVKRGGTPNCGCLTRTLIGRGNSRHGLSKHPLYAVWRGMIDRCRLPSHHAYPLYGGRGITVCQRWVDRFENFWDDMYPSYKPGLTLDRENNNLGYSKKNCRWATRSQQAMNTRKSVSFNAKEIAARNGISINTVYYRAKHGLPLDGPSIFAIAARNRGS